MGGVECLGGNSMTPELLKLIEDAKKRVMTEEERRAQRISFAYGNAKIENPNITRNMVIEVDAQIEAERKK